MVELVGSILAAAVAAAAEPKPVVAVAAVAEPKPVVAAVAAVAAAGPKPVVAESVVAGSVVAELVEDFEFLP